MTHDTIKFVWVVKYDIPQWLIKAAHVIDATYRKSRINMEIYTLGHRGAITNIGVAKKGDVVVLTEDGMLHIHPAKAAIWFKRGISLRTAKRLMARGLQ